MTTYKINNWEEYWQLFDQLIATLTVDQKDETVNEFKRVQKYVSGLTDGWFDFLENFENAIVKNRSKMTIEQYEIANYLTTTLRESLTKNN